jgi:hypothetical protein
VQVGDDGPIGGPDQAGPGPLGSQDAWTDQGAQPGVWNDPMRAQAPWADPLGLQSGPIGRRPRSTLTIPVGTGRGGWLALAAALVVGAIGLIAVASHGGSGGPGAPLGSSSVLTWGDTAGDAISPADYRSIEPSATMAAVRRQLGAPASTGPNPLDQVSGTQQCLGYRSSGDPGHLFVFCFAGGRLTEKETF